MSCTLEELGERMSAYEFGLHYALQAHEPIEAPLEHAFGSLMAATANGTLKTPPGRLWQASDFVTWPWSEEEGLKASPPAVPQTVDEIMARVRAAGG